MDQLSSKIVAIRKAHRCFCCNRKFEIGSKMNCEVNVDDSIYSLYTCLACNEIINSFPERIEDDWDHTVNQGDFYELRSSDPKYENMTPEELLICLKDEKQAQSTNIKKQ